MPASADYQQEEYCSKIAEYKKKDSGEKLHHDATDFITTATPAAYLAAAGQWVRHHIK